MRCFCFIVLCVIAILIAATSGVDTAAVKSNVTDYLYKEIFDKTNDLVQKFNHTLESFEKKAVPTKELEVLQKIAAHYSGKWKSELDAKPMIKAAHETTTNYFMWSKDNVKDVIADFYSKDNIAAERVKQLKFCEGVIKWVKSVDSTLLAPLKKVDNELAKLSTNLNKLPSSLKAELQEIREVKKGDKKTGKLTFQFPALADVIGADKLKSTGIPDTVVQGKKQPNEEDKKKITEAYYAVLIKAVEKAQFSYSSSQLSVSQIALLHQRLSILIALRNGDECGTPEVELRNLQNTLTALIP